MRINVKLDAGEQTIEIQLGPNDLIACEAGGQHKWRIEVTDRDPKVPGLLLRLPTPALEKLIEAAECALRSR